MSEFVLTQVAKADLLKTLEYLDGDNPSAVLKAVDALYDALHGKPDVRRLLEE